MLSVKLSLLVLRELEIRDILYHFLYIIHCIRHGFFLCSIHNLLHAFYNFFLKVDSIKLFIYSDLWDNHRIMYKFACALHFLLADFCHSLFFLSEFSVFALLNLGKRLIEHLKLKGSLHVWAITKPKNQLIAGINTLVTHAGLVIQISQLVCPLLCILLVLELLQYRNQLVV